MRVLALCVACILLTELGDCNQNRSHAWPFGEKDVSRLLWRLLQGNNYNSRVRPGAGTDEPLPVNLSLYVSDIYHISESDMEFSMTFYLRERWYDSRLVYQDAHNSSITINYNQFTDVWTPDVFIRNLKSGSRHDLTVPNRLLRLYPDGSVLYSQRLSVTLSCEMDLQRYPMDNQTCFVNFGSYAYTTEDIILNWDYIASDNVPVDVNPRIRLPKFVLERISLGVCNIGYASTGVYPCLEAFFHLERRVRSQVFYIYLPSILVVILSWLSFWIDLEAVPARISLGILTILTVATQSTTINRGMPSLSVTKAVDVWMFVCLVFVFAAFVEYSVVNVLSRRYKHRQERAMYLPARRRTLYNSSRREYKRHQMSPPPDFPTRL